MIQILFNDDHSIEARSISLRVDGWVMVKVDGQADTDVRMFPREQIMEIRYDQRGADVELPHRKPDESASEENND